jgi:hypothetical protein
MGGRLRAPHRMRVPRKCTERCYMNRVLPALLKKHVSNCIVAMRVRFMFCYQSPSMISFKFVNYMHSTVDVRVTCLVVSLVTNCLTNNNVFHHCHIYI